jgi:hypothetical protein
MLKRHHRLAGASVGSRGCLFAVLEGAQQGEFQPALQKREGSGRDFTLL